MHKHAFLFAITAAVALMVSGSAIAADPAYTSIAVEKMCCNGCAQKIASQLYVLKGVKEVRVDIPKRYVFVFPQANSALSPRAIWEAIEKGDDKPLRLAGPSGTFDKKPKF